MTIDLNLVLQLVIPVIALGLGLLVRAVFKNVESEKALKATVAFLYPLVDALSKGTPNTVDDKIALALKLLNDYYNQNGKTLSPDAVAKAEELFRQMAGGK